MTLLSSSALQPKARTGISKPYNVKQIKTTNAREAEAAIRCLLEARGGRCSRASSLLFIFLLNGLRGGNNFFLKAGLNKSHR